MTALAFALVRRDDLGDGRWGLLLLPLDAALVEQTQEGCLLRRHHPGQVGCGPRLRIRPVVEATLGQGLQHAHEGGELRLAALYAELTFRHFDSSLGRGVYLLARPLAIRIAGGPRFVVPSNSSNVDLYPSGRPGKIPIERDDVNLVSLPLDSERIPWIPLGPGESFKPLRFLARDRGRVLLLRLEPGIVVPRHRHLGEVHGLNLSGRRKLLETGEIVGPGGYVYEPTGNVDSWMAVGDEPVVVHIIAYGAMEYLGENDEVLKRDTASSLREAYLRYCDDNVLAALDLGGER